MIAATTKSHEQPRERILPGKRQARTRSQSLCFLFLFAFVVSLVSTPSAASCLKVLLALAAFGSPISSSDEGFSGMGSSSSPWLGAASPESDDGETPLYRSSRHWRRCRRGRLRPSCRRRRCRRHRCVTSPRGFYQLGDARGLEPRGKLMNYSTVATTLGAEMSEDRLIGAIHITLETQRQHHQCMLILVVLPVRP